MPAPLGPTIRVILPAAMVSLASSIRFLLGVLMVTESSFSSIGEDASGDDRLDGSSMNSCLATRDSGALVESSS